MLCSTAPSLPWVAWASLPHLRRYYAPLRLPPLRLRSLRLSLASRYLACFHRSWSPIRARGREEAPGHARAFGHPVPHSSGNCRQGDRWLSHVPKFPLWRHAPLSDPGGVLRTRQNAPRTAAFRSLETVGFPLDTSLRDILWTTTILFSGLNHAACRLATPGFVRPLTGRHVGSLLTGWLGVSQVGLEPIGLAPTGKQ